MYTSMPLLLGFSTVKMGSKVGISPLEGSSTVHYLFNLRDKFKLSQKKTCLPLDLRLGLRMDFLLCPILRPNILGHILFK